MRGKMTPGLAAGLALVWALLGVAQLWDGRQQPLQSRHFWFGICGIVFAILYGYRCMKLLKASKADQGERK